MSTTVTIPTANYVNSLSPEKLPLTKDFDQQVKLWRFYCTCLDLGCPNYKLEDFLGKNMSPRDKYLEWLKDWKKHYDDVSTLIRLYKKVRSVNWFHAPEQESFRKRFESFQEYLYIKNPYDRHQAIVRNNLDKLRRSAQHLLNARFTAKLASEALVARQRKTIPKKVVDIPKMSARLSFPV